MCKQKICAPSVELLVLVLETVSSSSFFRRTVRAAKLMLPVSKLGSGCVLAVHFSRVAEFSVNIFVTPRCRVARLLKKQIPFWNVAYRQDWPSE